MAVTWEKLLYETQLSAWTGSTNLVTVGDLVLGGTNKRITFGTNDYLEFNNNWYRFYIDSNEVFRVDAGTFIIDNTYGFRLAGGHTYDADNWRIFSFDTGWDALVYNTTDNRYEFWVGSEGGEKLSLDATWLDIVTSSGAKLTGTTRQIQFDANDYLRYTSDTYHFYINNVSKVTVDANGLCSNDYINASSGYKVDGTQVYQFHPGMYTDATWEDKTVASDTGWLTLDTSTVFGVPAGVKALSIMVGFKDTGGTSELFMTRKEAAATSDFAVTNQVTGVLIYNNGIILCDTNGDFQYQITTSGANTAHTWLRIIGYWI